MFITYLAAGAVLAPGLFGLAGLVLSGVSLDELGEVLSSLLPLPQPATETTSIERTRKHVRFFFILVCLQ